MFLCGIFAPPPTESAKAFLVGRSEDTTKGVRNKTHTFILADLSTRKRRVFDILDSAEEFRMNPSFKMAAICLSVFLTFGAFAQEEEEKNNSFTHWDQIVNDLKASIKEETPAVKTSYGMDDLQISAGMDLSFAYLSVSGDPRFEGSGLLKGVGLSFGIDLFDPEIQAEGSFRNYSSEALSKDLHAEMREFELKLVNSKRFSYGTRLRLGLGIAARSLDLKARTREGTFTKTESSPSAVFTVGFGRTFGRNLFIGPDVSYRTAIAGDDFHQSSLDIHLKANALF
jgi:hypothetical protein